jgi:hypothetical protein
VIGLWLNMMKKFQCRDVTPVVRNVPLTYQTPQSPNVEPLATRLSKRYGGALSTEVW